MKKILVSCVFIILTKNPICQWAVSPMNVICEKNQTIAYIFETEKDAFAWINAFLPPSNNTVYNKDQQLEGLYQAQEIPIEKISTVIHVPQTEHKWQRKDQ